jgi:hypothetical protein
MKDVLCAGLSFSFLPLSQSLSSRQIALAEQEPAHPGKPGSDEGQLWDRQIIDVPRHLK